MDNYQRGRVNTTMAQVAAMGAAAMGGVAMGEVANQQQGRVGGEMVGEARRSAKGLMRDRAERLRREADQLEALARALPEELPLGADGALWDLLVNDSRRR